MSRAGAAAGLLLVLAVPAIGAERRLFSPTLCAGRAVHLSCHFSGGVSREVEIAPDAPFDVVKPSPAITWTDREGTHLFVNPCEILCRAGAARQR